MTLSRDLSELETYLSNALNYLENLEVETGSSNHADKAQAVKNVRNARQLL